MSQSSRNISKNTLKSIFAAIVILTSLLACSVQPILTTDIPTTGLVFSEEAENATVLVSNIGGGTLDWTGTLSDFRRNGIAQAAWLDLVNSSGQVARTQSEQVTLKRSVMPAGNYTATLTLTYPYNGAPVSENFQIKATVIDRPKINIDSPFTTLDVAAGQTSFYIQNGSFSEKVLNWNFDNLPSWLIADKSSGSLSAGQEQLVRLSLKAGVVPQNYSVDLGISGTDAARKTLKVVANYQGCVAQSANVQLATQAFVNQDASDAEYVSGQVLVRFKDLAERDAVIQDYQEYGLALFEDGAGIIADVYLTSADPEALSVVLKQDERIENAQPNYYLKALTHDFDFPNDTFYDQQWYLRDYGIAEGWELVDARKQMKQKPIIVAVIDSGTDIAHVDLGSNLVPGCDFFSDVGTDNNPINPIDPHGTHVAGIVAAVTDNNIGTVGVSYLANVKVQPVKIFSDEQRSSISNAVRGIRWAAGIDVPNVLPNPTPAHILNFSVGKPAGTGDEELHKAVAEVVAAGKLFVSASGNQTFDAGNGVFSPANAPGAIAVGALDSDLQRSSFSKFDSTGVNTVDVVAPGGKLVTGSPAKCNSSSSSILNTFPNNQYRCQSGTSMATPYVSAVLALIWAKNPDWDAKKVEQRLYDSVLFDASWLGKENEYGKGLVCLDRALGTTGLCGRD